MVLLGTAAMPSGCPHRPLQVRKKPKEWIPDAVWLNIVALSNMDAFRDIPDSVFRNDGLWRQWYDQEAPEMAKVRVTWHDLQALCLSFSIPPYQQLN